MYRNFAGPARVINVILAIWLFISAFAWPHTMAQRTNTWVLGVVIFAFALAAMRTPAARYVNTILAIWLFISAFALHSIRSATVWNNWILAVVIFIFSLVPSALEPTAPGQQLPGNAPLGERRIPPPQQPRTV
jgi:hypothetical protein